MAGTEHRAAAFMRDGGAKAKDAGARIFAIAKDPATQEKAKKLVDDGRKVYQALTSPEAKRLYRQAAERIRRVQKR
ncbi:hypothetical protein D477_012545 [Arthrobacter crystallopoietes BAB-32]|uniref:Uncharacterized protein n=1 Tax=Arthrobacter crystallopoietes BAB-32 TaxID=1246476 RepID=N1V6N7_9MICC|nr:hypothetical protein [Arthrobacter crystallopoietes]EMY33908.1 hypothetical protein D477_012545 [Arthrobacter crystallopoietes BAB-32]